MNQNPRAGFRSEHTHTYVHTQFEDILFQGSKYVPFVPYEGLFLLFPENILTGLE